MGANRSVIGKARALVDTVRAHPLLNRLAADELRVDRGTRHPVEADHRPHVAEALAWLARAQDATGSGGVARGFSLSWNRYFRSFGWQPAYPETTGYIIPTWLESANELGETEWVDRAIRAAHWECDLQLETGAVQGGVVGEGRSPAVFNTGQVMFGWLAAWEHSGEKRFSDALTRAGLWLVEMLESDGLWRKGNSRFALSEPTLYNARVAWALAEAGVALGDASFVAAARRNLQAVARAVLPNGFIPNCCLIDPTAPLLHTLAYATRGLLEGGRVLQDPEIAEAGARAARAIAHQVEGDGRMAGRFDRDWRPTVDWSCLTGQVQMANNWIRLYLITGESEWLRPVPSVLAFVKSTQNRRASEAGLRGGIKGSWPVDGEYGRFELLNWAAKYFVDALLRYSQVESGRAEERAHAFRLA